MTALIPFHMSECLAPKEVSELLTAAEQERASPEDFIIEAIRERLARRRKESQQPAAEPKEAA